MINFFEKILGKKKAVVGVETIPLSEEQKKFFRIRREEVYPPQWMTGCAQSVGQQRDHNEDALFCLDTVVAEGNTSTAFGIFIIADGMGGHEFGEVASSTAVHAMAENLVKHIYLPLVNNHAAAQGESLQEIMESAVEHVQRLVTKKAPGGGTTLTAAVIFGNMVTIAHVGDSRAYFIHAEGRMEAVTQDHSLVRRLQELGQITEDEAVTHPQRNVLYRAIGQAEPFRPDIQTLEIPPQASLMICSDGLWGVITEKEMFRIIRSSENPTSACEQLVKAANEAGGPDNITVILVEPA
jgi:serine/threonine protein phosphatase PrpC